MENICSLEYILAHPISQLLGHSFMCVLATAFIIHIFINVAMKKKELKLQKRKDAIKTTEEISVLLNDVLSCLFWKIRGGEILPESINSAIRNAFQFRLKYKIKVETYFTKEYDREYDDIINEMELLRRSIKRYETPTRKPPKKELKYVEEHINTLRTEWNDNTTTAHNPYLPDNYETKSPYDAYLQWNLIIWRKSKRFTSELYKLSQKF